MRRDLAGVVTNFISLHFILFVLDLYGVASDSPYDRVLYGEEVCWCSVLSAFFAVRGGFKDEFEGISWFSYDRLEKCRAIIGVADYVGVFYSKSCGDAVFLVAC